MPNICGFDRILKTEWNLQHFTRNCRKCEGEKSDNMLSYEQVSGNVFERGEVNVVEY